MVEECVVVLTINKKLEILQKRGAGSATVSIAATFVLGE
jgi:hypothetical protein